MFKLSALYASLLGLWIVFLVFNVIRLRYKYRVGLNDGGQAGLTKAIRVHANNTETIPIMLILFCIAEGLGTSALFLNSLGAIFMVARVTHAWGIAKSSGVSWQRTIGMVGTITIMIVLSINNLLSVF